MTRIRFDRAPRGTLRRTFAMGLGAVLLVLAVLLGVVAWRAGGTDPQQAPSAQATQKEASADRRAVGPAAPASAAPVKPLAAQLQTPSAGDAGFVGSVGAYVFRGATKPTDAFDVCGHGRLTEAQIERQWPPEMVQAARSRIAAALMAGNEREQAVGWLLQRSLAVEAAQIPALRACAGDADCRSAVQEKPVPAASASVAELVALAERSRDPWVYATALNYVCSPYRSDPSGTCSRLGAATWAERDADNAAPWLMLATQAAERGDAAATDAALANAAARPRNALHFGAPHGVLARHPAMRELPPVLRARVLEDVWGYTAAVPLPLIGRVVTFCSAAAMREPVRRAQCTALVSLFGSDSATLIELAIGSRIAERGALLPPDELLTMQDERRSLQTAHLHWIPVERMMSCQGLERHQRYEEDLDTLGEVGAMRRSLAATGRPLAEWAVEGRRRDRAREQAEAAAASAPR